MTTIKGIEKGCGKEIEHNIKNEIITCGNSSGYVGNLPNGIKAKFLFKLCPICEAKLQTKKEDLEIIDNFIDELEDIHTKVSLDDVKYGRSKMIVEFISMLYDLKQRIEGKQGDGE